MLRNLLPPHAKSWEELAAESGFNPMARGQELTLLQWLTLTNACDSNALKNVAQGFSPASAPWRADLAALERQLKTEFRATQASAKGAQVQTAHSLPATDADITRRVRALVEDSEKRQQRELALRIAELLRDVNAQRQADLVKIDRTLGVVQNNVGVEVMKTRQQMNQMDLIYRASQRQ